MSKNIFNLIYQLPFFERLVVILFLLMPFALLMSILVAEIISSLITIIFLFWIFSKKNFASEFKDLKIPVCIFILFYGLILISLIMSNDFNKSFLPSFFYFRYFLFPLAIFYILKNYEFSLKLLLLSLSFLFILVFFDSLYELLVLNNIFGLNIEQSRIDAGTHYHLTSFFHTEKKLGSFLIRLLPLVISLILYLEIKNFKKINLINLIILTVGMIIFLSSERTAFLLYIIFLILSFKFLRKKLFIVSIFICGIIFISLMQPKLINKQFIATLNQLGIINNYEKIESIESMNFSKMNYISDEHEKLIKSGFEIFKENPLTGSGIKTYHETCNEIKIRKSLDIVCSTHPHNTYIQILSDTGILTTLIIFLIFLFLLFQNLKIFFTNEPSKKLKSLYILNIGIILNLMPFIPSGSFFNNWINLMIYFPLCFWFYLLLDIKKKSKFLNEFI